MCGKPENNFQLYVQCSCCVSHWQWLSAYEGQWYSAYLHWVNWLTSYGTYMMHTMTTTTVIQFKPYNDDNIVYNTVLLSRKRTKPGMTRMIIRSLKWEWDLKWKCKNCKHLLHYIVTLCIHGLSDGVGWCHKLLHLVWGGSEAKCTIAFTAACVSICPSPHSHTTARTRMYVRGMGGGGSSWHRFIPLKLNLTLIITLTLTLTLLNPTIWAPSMSCTLGNNAIVSKIKQFIAPTHTIRQSLYWESVCRCGRCIK